MGERSRYVHDLGFSIASTFFAVCLALAAGVWASSGCQSACQSDIDCEGSGYCDQSSGRCERDCFTNEDCLRPPACRDNPVACQPAGQRCSGAGRCVGSIENAPGGTPGQVATGLENSEGADDPLGSGLVFVVNRLQIAGPGVGFDIDQNCGDACEDPEGCPDACVDNRMVDVGPESNTSIQRGLEFGASILLVELAGLDTVPFGFDDSFTIKLYSGLDGDEPPIPENNFAPPPGRTSCCKFRSLDPEISGTAKAGAVLEYGEFRTVRPVRRIDITLALGREPNPELSFRQVSIRGRLNSSLRTIENGLFGGAVPISSLATNRNPFCWSGRQRSTCFVDPLGLVVENSLLDHATQFIFGPPDIDLDLDGLQECVYDTDGNGFIDTCCQGDCAGPCAPDNLVTGIDPTDPASCAANREMGDGYSIALTFSGTRAELLQQ